MRAVHAEANINKTFFLLTKPPKSFCCQL